MSISATLPFESRAVNDFIKMVRQAISEREWSVVRLSKESGISRVYLQNMLSGKHDPSLTMVEKLGKVLGIKVRIEAARKKSRKTA